MYAVRRGKGAGFDEARPWREQDGFEVHRQFISRLGAAGTVVVGGSLTNGEVLLVFDVDTPDDVHAALADDPWTVFDIAPVTSIEAWGRPVLSPALSDQALVMLPVARVAGGRSQRIDDDWGDVEATIVIDDRFEEDAIAGLGDFSHIDVVFVFDQIDEAAVTVDARHPRGNHDWPAVGIFAQRASARPNRIGVTTCELVGVEGRSIRVRGLDAIDATPVIDIKPHVREFEPRGDVAQPVWMTELMSGYW
jgi:tRNA-Thr(GGU) m(6)t(6)A37 methyltransferase TsaA